MKRPFRFAFFALIALSLIQILGPQLHAQGRMLTNQPQEGVCFFTDANYRGESFCVSGNERQPSLGNFNDRISSIRVFGGAEVTVFEDSNFNGSRQTITQDMPHLGNWNDRISSFQVTSKRQFGRIPGRPSAVPSGRPQSNDGVCFYTDADFRGESICFNNNDEQSSLGGYNDRISSIRIFGNAEVTVYEDSNFNGARRTITQDMAHLGDWGDRISSFQVTPSRQFGRQNGRQFRNRNGACFFVDANFRGESFCMSAGDSQRSLEARFKDNISSIQVFGNARVIVYENTGFGGASRTYTSDRSNLAGDFNDKISSIEVK